ncbi:MAG: hypothetical protein ACI9TV_000325 [Sulfurimonas sp.]|jgi:hypothetical protein|uniref:hypothetical protein n=1 Tax=Sulfurimonas sp. TaxID=2022749 RepID=UPI0039E597D7
MTYGEYNYLLKESMTLKNGVWIATRPAMSTPAKMSRKEASIYYTCKFSKYWESKSN